jgi:hypothetical protein
MSQVTHTSTEITNSTVTTAVIETSGTYDAGNLGCNPQTEFLLVQPNPEGPPSEYCDPLPQACLSSVTCMCLLTAKGWTPADWFCMDTPGGLVVNEADQ